jgi:hypothetical protein
MAMTFSVESITPERAAELLGRGGANRPLSDGKVKEWAAAMRAGEWRLTHQGIALGPTGEVLDGQHRLTAVVRSGVTVEMMVARDMPAELFPVIDAGKVRNNADALAIAGFHSVTAMAATVRLLDGYYRGGRSRSTLNNTDALAFATTCGSALVAAVATSKTREAVEVGLSPSAGAAAFYLIRSTEDPRAELFITGLLTGTGLYPGDPRLLLARTLQRAAIGRHDRTVTRQLALAGKAWNAYVHGRPAKLLKWLDEEPMPRFWGANTVPGGPSTVPTAVRQHG